MILVSLHGALQSPDLNVLRQVEQIAAKNCEEATTQFVRQSFSEIGSCSVSLLLAGGEGNFRTNGEKSAPKSPQTQHLWPLPPRRVHAGF